MVIVEIEQGTLKGLSCPSDYGDYIAFKGIPYAKPPLGDLRFKAPEPPLSWEGVRDASEHGPECPHFDEKRGVLVEGSEDCLYLNVYTKDVEPKTPKAVMVWIHGGGFKMGSGNSSYYGPEFLVGKDIVLVTINYRLEVLGFLCLDTEEVPGNAGLKDQVAALHWVYKNIHQFGGNPKNITIFGCSAGSASVSFHMLSPMSRGLFSKAICMSGVCLNDWAYVLNAKERAFQLGKLLGRRTENVEELYEFLKTAPVQYIVNVQLNKHKTSYKDLTDLISFGPVIEDKNLKCDHFISRSPMCYIRSTQFYRVPLIIGYTSGEGMETCRYLPELAQLRNEKLELNVPRELKWYFPVKESKAIGKKVKNFYLAGNEITPDTQQEMVNMDTDMLFTYNIRRFALHAAKHHFPVYFYRHNLETERNYTKRQYGLSKLEGVCHGDDIYYLFNVKSLNVPLTFNSDLTIDKMVSMWTNFAKAGNPTPGREFAFTWNCFGKDEENYLEITREPRLLSKPDNARMNFWEKLYHTITYTCDECGCPK